MHARTADDLKEKHCKPCEGEVAPLDREEAGQMLSAIPGWKLGDDGKSIRREWKTANFDAAMEFLDRVAGVARGEDHHPDLHLTGYRTVTIELSTHAIEGLSENDFILAAKIDDLPVKLKK